MKAILFCIFFVLINVIPYVIANLDPYETLGVQRDASINDIKKAYRDLAKKLHPDTSSLAESEANSRFIELNRAFNILKDPIKRKNYDLHGETGEGRHTKQDNVRHNRQSREYWTDQRFRTFVFSSTQDSYFRSKSISSARFYNEYLKESKIRPFLIFFYSDFCRSCKVVKPTWVKITEELAKYDIGSFSINVNHEHQLSSEIGVSSIPHIACLIDGQVKSYYGSELSLEIIIRLIKESLPRNLVMPLTSESDQDRFLVLGPSRNKLSAIFYHGDANLKLRYLLLAYRFRNYYRFGQISVKQSNHEGFATKYNLVQTLNPKSANLIIFDEDVKRPRMNIMLNGDNNDFVTTKTQLNQWPFLKLPKLNSQSIFDDLCIYSIPREGVLTRTKLCAILFVTDKPSTLQVRSKLVEFIEVNKLDHNDRVVFSFMDPTKQTDFVNALILETKANSPIKDDCLEMKIILIERDPTDFRKSVHKWINSSWNPNNLDELDKAKLELFKSIEAYLRNAIIWQDKLVLTKLFDQDGPDLLERIFLKTRSYVSNIFYFVVSRESFFTVSILIVCAVITSVLLYQVPLSSQLSMDNSTPVYEYPQERKQESPASNPPVDDIKIMELKAETYFGMIRLLKPGCRSLILLTDRETKDVLLPRFKKAVWPYRRNKTLQFGYLCLDKNLKWYKSLLEEVLGIDDLRVNKKNCIGTVLSLNGFKKYLRVYHTKHHEIDSYNDETDNDGSFLGFDDDRNDPEANCAEVNETREENYNIENLLDRLPIWLDKTFDGLTKRYFLGEWPEDME